MTTYFDVYIKDCFTKEAQTSPSTIKGPEVDLLINTVHNMMGLGAPTVFDFQGFNKQDYNSPAVMDINNLSPGMEMSIPLAVAGVRVLYKYKKTQVSNYDVMVSGISQLIDQAKGIQTTQTSVSSNKVIPRGQNQYGASLFIIHDLGRKASNIKKLIESSMIRMNDNRESWKVFIAAIKEGIDVYQIDPKYINILKVALDAYGYDTSEMTASPEQLKTDKLDKPGKPELKSVVYRDDVLYIDLGGYDVDFISFIKRLPSRLRTYDSQSRIWGFIRPDQGIVKETILVLDKHFDTQQLKDILPRLPENSEEFNSQTEEKKIEGDIPLKIKDITQNTKGKWHLAFGSYTTGSREGDYLKEIIKFMFPVYGPDGERMLAVVPTISSPYDPADPNDPNHPRRRMGYSTGYEEEEGNNYEVSGYKEYLVRGNYNKYRQLSSVLKRYGFDNKEFNKIIAGLITNNIVKITRIEGDLEGFQKERKFVDAAGNERITKVNDINKFDQEVTSYNKKIIKDGKEINFELYDLQKDGIAFLYGRNSAILGDSTGLGKTNMLIIAADMRIKQHGGKVLIITLNQTQNQWIEEIKRFAKVNPEDISVDPLRLATWTVLTYVDFQVKSTRDAHTQSLQQQVAQGNITCMILDECHSIKNTTATRTENIQNISSYTDEKTGQTHTVPFAWGASATIVANRPIDVYNQLKAVNHPLGRLSFKTFAENFGAMVKGRYGLEDASIEDQVIAANKLKEWLINFKVFVSRTKEDVRKDMPGFSVDDVPVKVDMKNLYQCISGKLETYKNPNLPVSVMIATRDCLASAKAIHSAKLANDVLREGKKVMVFTAFRDAASRIQFFLQKILNDIGHGGQVLPILGGMHQKTKNETIRQFKDPNSNIRALVLGIAAGGTGLDFPNVVETVIENDFDWTPASTEQMRGRAYRISSNRPVKSKSLIAEGTPDEQFKEKVDNKIQIAEVIGKLTQEQLDLFSRGKHRDDLRLKEIEKQLIDMVGKQIAEEEDEARFQENTAKDILSHLELGGYRHASKKTNNWYKQARSQ
jgi:hypothetical protein